MNRLLAIGHAMVLACAVGCGRKELPFTDNSQDAELYAQNVRSLAESIAEAARRSAEPRTLIQLIVTELSQTDRPQGNHQATYKEMLAAAHKIIDRCPPGGGRAPIDKELDELLRLARTLPAKR